MLHSNVSNFHFKALYTTVYQQSIFTTLIVCYLRKININYLPLFNILSIAHFQV